MKKQLLPLAVGLALAISGMVEPAPVRAAEGTYRLVEHWAQLPTGTEWGVMSWVATDENGQIYAFQRDEPTSKVIVFDGNGKHLKTWGEGAFPYAHSLRVLRDGSVWITDRGLQQVLKFSPDGKLLMTIGEKGVAGDNQSQNAFNGVSDVVMAENGHLFVSDGEGNNTRVVKLTKDGKFIKSWGTKGDGPGHLNGPHCITLDSKGRVFVCDRQNKRIQVFDQEGKYLDQMAQFGTPASIFIDKNDVMYVAAGAPENKVTIGTTAGKVLETIEGLNAPHGLTVDARGTLYVAQSAGKALLKYVRK